MNVGQVDFSVTANGLKEVLKMAKQLEQTLNGIDGKTYGGRGGGGGVVRPSSRLKAHQQAMRMVANDEKKYAIQQKTTEKRNAVARVKTHRAALKMVASDEKKYAIQNHMRQVRLQKQRDKAHQDAMKMSADIEYKAAIREHEQKVKAQKEEDKRQQQIQDSKNSFRKEQAELEKNVAVQQHFRKLKDIKDEQKAEEKALLQQSQVRAEYQRGIQQQFVNMGAQMQTLGAAMQRVTAPFAGVFRGIAYGVGYRLLGKVTESISGAFSRYDTIKTYSKVLTNLGIDATKKFSVAGQEATDVYHNLENAVLGLPTGIDEIIESMRRYAGATGEAEKATKLAIAANNAYIAGNMGEREKLFTERQLVALAGGATLSTNQWDSLRRNAPLAMKVVAKDMKMSVQEMIDSLKKGEISGQRFLDVFISAGTQGKIKDAAQVMKVTWDAVSQNIQNRLNAMGEGILNTLNDVFKAMDGRSFLQHVLGFDKNNNYMKGHGIRGFIDDMSESVQKWIRSNPQKITEFFDLLKSIDFKGIASGFAQMGLYLGKFYLGLAKIAGAGNGNLIKWMINLNMLGKIIQITGGFFKGLAWPISKVLTALRFMGTGEIAAGSAEAAMTGMTATGKAAQTMVLTWQGVANKAVSIAAIPAFAWSLRQAALALQDIGKVDINWGKFGKNLAQMAIGIGAMATASAGLGAAMAAGGPLSWLTTSAMGAGGLAIAGLSKTMKWLAEGLNAIADADLPSTEKIRTTMQTMREIEKSFTARNPFEAIGRTIDAWTKGSEFKAIKSLGDAFGGITNIASVQMPRNWKEKVTKRMSAVKQILSDFQDVFLEFDAENQQTYTSTTPVKGRFGRKTTNATSATMQMQTKTKQFADSMENVSKAFNSIVGVVENAVKIDKAMAKAMGSIPVGTNGEKIGGMFTKAKQGLKQLTQGLYDFLGEQGENGGTMMENLQEVSSSFHAIDITGISKQISAIPKIIKAMVKVNNEIATDARSLINTNGTGSVSNFASNLTPIFNQIKKLNGEMPTDLKGFDNLTAINTGIARIKRTIVKLRELSAMGTNLPDLSSIKNIAEAVKEALAELEQIGEKKINIEFKAEFKGSDEVVKDTKKELEKIKKKILSLNASVTKKVNVNLTAHVAGIDAAVAGAKAGLNAAMEKIRRLNATVNKPITVNAGGHASRIHTGGKVGSPLYRSGGGSVFAPRGTDVIPSMLTEGEYVIQRMAAHYIGDDVLQRLNHMDIAGAIKGLYARAGNVSTVNNTKNANLTINNYNAPSVGFVKGNRWVQSI